MYNLAKPILGIFVILLHTTSAFAATYDLLVKTGNDENSGTDATVKIRLHGATGTTDWYILDNSANNFERGQLESFRIGGPDIGAIQWVEVRTDGAGSRPDWYLDWISVNGHRLDCYTWVVGPPRSCF